MKKILLLCFGVMVALPCWTQVNPDCCFDPARVSKDSTFIQSQSKIVLIETPNGEEWRITIKREKVVVAVPVITFIDDTGDPATAYVGTWSQFANTSWLSAFWNKTGTFSSITNNSFTTSFTGHTIEWHTEGKNNHGIAGVSIDGGPEVMVDLYRNVTTNNSQLMFSKSGLVNGPHTIKIRVTGTKSAASTDPSIIHDRFVVIK